MSNKILLKYYLLTLTLLTLNIGLAQTSQDYLKTGNELKFSSQEYTLTRSGKPYNNYYIQEYIRSTETVKNFEKSVVIIAIVDTTTVDQLVSIKMNELDKLKESNKSVTYQILFNEGEGRIMEFSLSNGKYHFWNIQRYEVQTLNDGRQVGLMYTYIERKLITDKRSIKDIMDAINEKRVGYITEVGEIELPIANP